MINAIMLLAHWVIGSTLGYNLNGLLGLYFPKSKASTFADTYSHVHACRFLAPVF
jgi:hypothetical protein